MCQNLFVGAEWLNKWSQSECRQPDESIHQTFVENNNEDGHPYDNSHLKEIKIEKWEKKI